ncbi:cytidine deaminase [Waterburya agarophytonicola K14]|uniref:Cytidine deaminase n=1 Tax=Waterburya agarophytonicola KI4 TaxID=2874699 RepID=A0A964BUG1_9CYAN|nr:cytidine deaminase [Waterburya agarophytonicola]MCC0178733.1 cytidine deaminase [Waterburya agarophytonicola KI4]
MNQSILTEVEKQQLIETATQALDKSYAPYSKFRVGAAVLTSTGKIFPGCNVENASYGLSMCAERNAIANAIIGSGKDTIKIKAIAVTNSQKVSCSPCGACRQVIWEFGTDAEVIFLGNNGWQNSTIRDLLPAGFSL